MRDPLIVPVITGNGVSAFVFQPGDLDRVALPSATVRRSDDLIVFEVQGISGLTRFAVDRESELDMRAMKRFVLMEADGQTPPRPRGDIQISWDEPGVAPAA